MSDIDFEHLLKRFVENGKLEEIRTDSIHLYRIKGQGNLWATKDQLRNALEALTE